MTPADLLEEFVRHLRVERGLSPCTWKSYGYQIRGYLRFLEGRRSAPASAAREDVLAYLEARKDAGVTGSTLFAGAIALRLFHRFLAERGHTASDPTVGMKLPKYHQRLPEPLSVAEMEKLLSLPTGEKFHRIRMKAALECLYSTGMRVSELLGLTLGKVGLVEGWIRLKGKGSKERVVPLGPRAKDALLRYLDARELRFPGDRGLIFLTDRGRPVSRTTFWRQLQRLAMRAGLSGVFPHRIRHSTATHLLGGGADLRVLAELLGHSSVAVTQRYTHISPEGLREACRRSHPRF